MKTEILKIHPEFPELDKVSRCAKVIRKGGLVVFPTETVYGIAADFDNAQAMKRLRDIKQRAKDKPFSIHISQKDLISNYTPATDPMLYKLIEEYWPGPLTVVVPTFEDGQTIGIRIPDNRIALFLVREAQCAVASPSANVAGQPPPSSCEEALRDLDGLVDLAIDGGPAQFGQSSSVVDFTGGRPQILREGVIKQSDVERVTGRKTILFVCTGNSCRSVMAEFLLKDKTRGRQDIEVVSAGTGVFIRSTASAETQVVLKERGIDASQHQSQPMSNTLLHKADLILVMTRSHRQQVLGFVPSVEKRVYLLREFTSEPAGGDLDLDIPDPIGKSHQQYEECLLMIEGAIQKLINLI